MEPPVDAEVELIDGEGLANDKVRVRLDLISNIIDPNSYIYLTQKGSACCSIGRIR
jgi:hypothetical protein